MHIYIYINIYTHVYLYVHNYVFFYVLLHKYVSMSIHKWRMHTARPFESTHLMSLDSPLPQTTRIPSPLGCPSNPKAIQRHCSWAVSSPTSTRLFVTPVAPAPGFAAGLESDVEILFFFFNHLTYRKCFDIVSNRSSFQVKQMPKRTSKAGSGWFW